MFVYKQTQAFLMTPFIYILQLTETSIHWLRKAKKKNEKEEGERKYKNFIANKKNIISLRETLIFRNKSGRASNPIGPFKILGPQDQAIGKFY